MCFLNVPLLPDLHCTYINFNGNPTSACYMSRLIRHQRINRFDRMIYIFIMALNSTGECKSIVTEEQRLYGTWGWWKCRLLRGRETGRKINPDLTYMSLRGYPDEY